MKIPEYATPENKVASFFIRRVLSWSQHLQTRKQYIIRYYCIYFFCFLSLFFFIIVPWVRLFSCLFAFLCFFIIFIEKRTSCWTYGPPLRSMSGWYRTSTLSEIGFRNRSCFLSLCRPCPVWNEERVAKVSSLHLAAFVTQFPVRRFAVTPREIFGLRKPSVSSLADNPPLEKQNKNWSTTASLSLLCPFNRDLSKR